MVEGQRGDEKGVEVNADWVVLLSDFRVNARILVCLTPPFFLAVCNTTS